MTWTYRSAFTTLENVIYQLALNSSSDTVLPTDVQTLVTTNYANHKQWLLSLIYEESNYLANSILYRTFVPYVDTAIFRRHRFWDAWYGHDCTLRMPDDILSISSVTWVGTSLTSSQYRLANENWNPNSSIEIDPDAISAYPSDFDESVQVTGIFGYHTDPDNMWVDSGDTVQTDIDASVTAIAVADADAIGLDGFTRFQTLQYIRIESEYLQITGISANTLTVKRAQLGTTAASHVTGTQIDVFMPDALINQATRRLVVQRFLNPSEQRILQTTADGSTIQIADEKIALPPMRWQIGSV